MANKPSGGGGNRSSGGGGGNRPSGGGGQSSGGGSGGNRTSGGGAVNRMAGDAMRSSTPVGSVGTKNSAQSEASKRMASADNKKDKGKDDKSGGVKRLATQAMQTMTALNEQAFEQNRTNMAFAAGLDERLNESNLSRTIELAGATGAEERQTLAEQGTQSRANILAGGEQQRETIGTTGEQERLTIGTTGEQQRLTQAERYAGEAGLLRTGGEETRKGIETTGTQQRLTDLQQEMFRRYKENRDYEQAQRQYRT